MTPPGNTADPTRLPAAPTMEVVAAVRLVRTRGGHPHHASDEQVCRAMTAAASASAAPAPVPALAGFTVGVTAARRAEELGTMLERRGAVVVHGPAIRIVPLADDTDLLGALGSGTLIARGPKARGAIRATGLHDAWSPESESSAEVLDHLLAEGVEGKRIAVQLHGEPLPDVVEALTLAGAEVVEVPVYRWEPPVDIGPMDRLTDAVLASGVDVLAFTSAPAAASLLRRADERGVRDDLLRLRRGPVLALGVGPVTAAPLEALDVPTVQPHRSRLGAMVRRLESEMPARARSLPVAGHRLELRGQAVVVDGELRVLPPNGMTLLQTLARRPGRVVPRSELLAALPGRGNDEHAVETAIARLRTALGNPKLVQTVVKRGYRLALDPAAGPVPVGGHCLHGDAV